MTSLHLEGGSDAFIAPTGGMGAFNTVEFNQWGFNQEQSGGGSGDYYYLFDPSANTRYLLDSDESVTDSELYRAFGERVAGTGNTRNPYRFQGQVGPYTDAANRVWMRARIYGPMAGQWYSADPIGFGGGDWNLYRFVGNNPANSIDPKGLDAKYTGLFVAWYYTKKGQPMYLKQGGRLNNRYFNHPSFRGELKKWMNQVKKYVKDTIALREKYLGVKKARAQDFQTELKFRGVTDVTRDDELFAIGGSLPTATFGILMYWEPSCQKYVVWLSAHYMLKDRFEEPFYTKGYGLKNTESPGAVPYDIIAEKKESFKFFVK